MDSKDKKTISKDKMFKSMIAVTCVAVIASTISISITVKQSKRVKELDAMFIAKANNDFKGRQYDNLEASIEEKKTELHELCEEADSVEEEISTKKAELRELENGIDEKKEQKEADNTIEQSAVQAENAKNSMKKLDKALSSEEIDIDKIVDAIFSLDEYDKKLKTYEDLIDAYSKEAEAYAIKYKDNDYIQNLAEYLADNNSIFVIEVKDLRETIDSEDGNGYGFYDKEYVKRALEDNIKEFKEYKERISERFKYFDDYVEDYEHMHSDLLEAIENEK